MKGGSKKFTRAISFLQFNFRHRRSLILTINNELESLFKLFTSIMNRLNTSFEHNIINQHHYNKYMNENEQLLKQFYNIHRPVSFRTFLIITPYKLLVIISLIKNRLISISKNTGATKLKHILQLLFNASITKKQPLLKLYNKIFIPIDYTLYNKNITHEGVYFTNKSTKSTSYKKLDESIKSTAIILSPQLSSQNDLLNTSTFDMKYLPQIGNKTLVKSYCWNNKSLTIKLHGARMFIPFHKNILAINGYFNTDSINLICHHPLFLQKYNFLKTFTIPHTIPKIFTKSYINQISLKDFIVFTHNELMEKCFKAYQQLKKLKKKTISSLVKEFLLSDISQQRNILTLFLLDQTDTDMQSLACLLYDMITNESALLSTQPLSEKIFLNLHWSIQKKFKTILKKVENTSSKLLQFKEDSIPYEKRICLMKCSERAKQKALERVREINNSKGDSNAKANNYVEGFLKIPFGIYKEEPIISFLSNFKKNIIQLASIINTSFTLILKKNNLSEEIQKIIKIHREYSNIYSNTKNNTFTDIEQYLAQTNKTFEKLKEFRDKNKHLLDTNYNVIYKKNSQNTCKTLKKKLKNLEIIQSGNKKELVKRLTDYTVSVSKINKKGYELFKSQEYLSLYQKFVAYNEEWISYKKQRNDYMTYVDKTLNKAVYGLDEAKRQIKRVIAQWINGEMKGYVFGFEGPPGTGKTTIAKKGIAQCLIDEDNVYRPFAFIALGGSSNGSTLEGHNYTYVGSTWGRIVDILMEQKCMNPIIYIDELDKISKTEHGKEIVGILTHLTDSSQNEKWCDKYFAGIELDLSKALIIFSYNDPNSIDKILLDRIHRIQTKSLNPYEKTLIVQDFLLPEILEDVGFKKSDIIIKDEDIQYLINTYTYEAGVRRCKERVVEIVREINLRNMINKTIEFPLTVTEELIQEIFSEKRKIQLKKIADKPNIGLVNGLYATSSGVGGLTIIEAFKHLSEKRLSLELTGQQGNVMKESMSVAKTVAWNLLPNTIKENIRKQKPFGIHIHCPEGATPKDGPSAGCAITVALISLLLQIPVNNTIALTGEIDLKGEVHAIGGLESKLEGAKKAGVTKVLVPFKNKDDLEKIRKSDYPPETENFKVFMVKHIKEVLLHILVLEDDAHFWKLFCEPESLCNTDSNPDEFNLCHYLCENSTDIITIHKMDKNGEVTYISPSFTEYFGWKKKDIIGKRVLDYIHPDDLTIIEEHRKKTLDEGSAENIQFRIRDTKDQYHKVTSNAKKMGQGVLCITKKESKINVI